MLLSSFHFQLDAPAIAWFALTLGSLVIVALIVAKPRTSPTDMRLERLGLDEQRLPTGATSLGGQNGGPQITGRRGRPDDPSTGSRDRMLQAGLYSSSADAIFRVLRLVLLVIPIAAGYWIGHVGWLTTQQGLLVGVIFGLIGTLAPGLWLDHLKVMRQTKIRRALPDALDVISVCLQGGLSLSVALAHVARELNLAHPALAAELNIMERQIQLGASTGDAIREMANRFDLDELRSMSSVIRQAERIGASVAGALELFADSMRVKRHQRAEELAHKAAVKLLIPTLFFVFPPVFIVILGPAMIHIVVDVLPGLIGGH